MVFDKEFNTHVKYAVKSHDGILLTRVNGYILYLYLLHPVPNNKLISPILLHTAIFVVFSLCRSQFNGISVDHCRKFVLKRTIKCIIYNTYTMSRVNHWETLEYKENSFFCYKYKGFVMDLTLTYLFIWWVEDLRGLFVNKTFGEAYVPFIILC